MPYEKSFEYPLEIPLDPSEIPLEGFFEYPLKKSPEPTKKVFFTNKAVYMDLFRYYSEASLESFYKGFKEAFKIASSIETSISPITDTTKVNSPNICTDISPDYTKDLFSPSTLKELDLLIKENESNINNIYRIPLDDLVKHNNYESLLEEREYLLRQKANHLRGVLQVASKTPLNDIDMDKLINNVNDLESYATSLRARAEAVTSRKLNT